MDDIAKHVKRIIAEQLCLTDEDIKPETRLDDENVIGIDSLDRLELVMAIEEAFELEIPDGFEEKLVTVQDVINYVIMNAPK